MTVYMRSLAARAAAGLAAVAFAAAAAPAAAQELGAGAIDSGTAPGWTMIPSVGYGTVYDDNISLFSRNTAESENNDLISTLYPSIEMRYGGRHTRFGAGYASSLVNYRTFSALNRYNQSVSGNIERQETARLQWRANATAASVPSTDLIELGGIPYQQTAANTYNLAGNVDFTFDARNSITGTAHMQKVDFERPETLQPALPGGQVRDVGIGYRRRQHSRLSVGSDYSFRFARVARDTEQFNTHTVRGTVEYALSPAWTMNAAAGIVHLQSTEVTESRTGPAYMLGVERSVNQRIFRADYQRTYIPSFGFGGTVENQEVGASLQWPLSRYFYTSGGFVFRNNNPITDLENQLPLRSMRLTAVLGWAPQPWVRVQGFYARVQQNSLTEASRIGRHRIGFQIVTSKPVRMR